MASTNSRTMSPPYAACATENAECAVWKSAKPSWCFAVRTAYCMPSRRASPAQARGLSGAGANVRAVA